MIVYGAAADVSIARLFIAGILPGLLVMALFSVYIAIWSTFRGAQPDAPEAISFAERVYASRRLIPIIALIVAVIGSIYAGIATPTEAAAVGVFGALILSALSGTLTLENFRSSLLNATATSCMIAFILAGSAFLTTAMAFTGIPRFVTAGLVALDPSPVAFLFYLSLVYLALGCFLDGISIIVLTTAVILPAVRHFGIDPIWFGVFIVIVVEVAMITPPVGFNLFVIQNLTGRDIFAISAATLPFLLLLLVAIAVLTTFPAIVTWLPSLL